jgi:hypothetical protein
MSMKRAISESIEGQKPSWKNALSRKLLEKLGDEELSRKAKAEAYLKDILEGGNVPTEGDLRSNAIMFAEYHSFVIKALEIGINPDVYYNVVSGIQKSMIPTQFGVHPEDIFSSSFHHDSSDQLKEQENTVSLWRKRGLPKFVNEKIISELYKSLGG